MATDDVPNSRPLRIFLSSTARDLPEHRKAVVGVIDRLGHAPVRMETFGARAGQSLVECRRLAAEADAMVVVVAHRYGWVPTLEEGGDGEKSITRHEVEAAVLAAKPVFRYLCDDTAASSDHRDDDVRMELFRQFLRRYPYDTFSTPDDLATKVAITLGDWSRRRARDFAAALQMIDLTGSKPQPETLRASTFFQVALIQRVLQRSAVSPAELDQVVEGSYLQAAKRALSRHVESCAEQLAALRGQLSSAQAEEREIHALVERLVAEPPPQRPAPPRPPSEDRPMAFDGDWNSPDRQRVRAMQHEAYMRELGEHQQAVARYEVSLTEYGKRQTTIPGERLRLEAVQQQVSQLAFNLTRLTNDCASEQRRLETEIGIARDQDISALLAAMRDQGVQQLTDPGTLSQGFLLLLATGLSCSFLSKYLSGHASAALRVEQVGHDVSEVAEETVGQDHQRIGQDCLVLLGPLQVGLAQGQEMTSLVRGVLDALSLDELRGFYSESQSLLAFGVPTVEAYSSLVDPHSIALAAIDIDRRRAELGQAIDAVHKFFEKSTALRASAQDAERRAAALLNRMQEEAAKYQLRLDDCKLAWTLVSRAQQSPGLGADTREFCACLQAEAKRRLGEPVEQLVARCESSDFGVRDAVAARAGHAATGFLKQSEALEKRLGELKARAAELERDSEAIAKLPWDQAEAYRKRFRLIALLTFVPVLNVLCGLHAGALVRRYDSAMRSDHPAYLGLGRWSLPWLLWAAGVSAVGVLASGFALSSLLADADETVVLLFLLVLSYGVSLVLWIFRTMRILGMEKQRRQNVLDSGHEVPGPGGLEVRREQSPGTERS